MNTYEHAKSASAGEPDLIALPQLSVLCVTGTDAAAFLDRQLSINVSSLSAGAAAMGCWCDAKGRSLCTLWIQRDQHDTDGFRLALHHSLQAQICKRLQMFILRAAVTVSPAPDLAMAVPAAVSSWPACCWHALCCVRDSESHTRPQLARQWSVHEIQSGLVWLDQHSSGLYLPQMLAMTRWQAVDFGKGCYPGQEVIARARYLGRVKRGLYRFEADLQAEPTGHHDDAVLDQAGNRTGTILTLGADSEHHRLHGLAVLQIRDTSSDMVLCYAGDDIKFTPVNDSAQT